MIEVQWTPPGDPECALGARPDCSNTVYQVDIRSNPDKLFTCVDLPRDIAQQLHDDLGEFLSSPTQTEVEREDAETDDTQIIGMSNQTYGLTAEELRTMADAADKLESLDIENDQTLDLNINGLLYRVTFGWDDTGCYGVLAAWMVD